MTDPVGSDKRNDRHPALGQPSGVFNCCRRCADVVRRGPALENMQQSCDILLDTRIEELLDDAVTTQFRYVLW